MPESIKLYYFPVRSRAETARLLLTYGGTKFEDIRISIEQWPAMKEKMPMGQMPVLEVDGKQLCQSTAICRYLARQIGLAGKTNWDMARADMLADGVLDMWGHLKSVYLPKLQGNQESADENWAIFAETHLKVFLERYKKFLDENGTGWFVGNELTWADIAVAEFLSVLQDCFNKNALDSHAELKPFVDKVFSLPQLKTYVANRPPTPI